MVYKHFLKRPVARFAPPGVKHESQMNQEVRIGRYSGLTVAQLIELLEKRDRSKKLGLVWERDEIAHDDALSNDFVACAIQRDLSTTATAWKNLVIEGDNFNALRWLRIGYSGKIKCIYIDPPYNTGGKDWVYNDNYFNKNDRYRHSTWLEFMYQRLVLARDLLTDDGVVMVSINDENRGRLELLMDEAFPGMRIGSMVWRSRTGGNEGGDAFLSDNHEHILLYGKPGFRFGGTEKTFEMYSNPDHDENGDWRKSDMTVAVAYTDKRAGKAYYPLYNPKTDIWYPCNPDAVWRYASREKSGIKAKIKTKFIEDWVAEDRIIFPESAKYQVWNTEKALIDAIRSGDVPRSGKASLLREDLPDLKFWIGKKVGFGAPAFKRYKKDLKNPTQPLSSWITPKSEWSKDLEADDANLIVSGTNDEGAKTIKEIFGTKAFNYAKPPSLIRELIRQASSPGDIILDFFAGSATTAQAVMELNAEDQGDRSFIMVSSTEATNDEPDKNVCLDVCARRIQRLNDSVSKKFEKLFAEFAYLRSRTIGMAEVDYELAPHEIWAALETMHSLPLTLYDPSLPWNEHTGSSTSIIYADRVTSDLIEELRNRVPSNWPTFVYCWAPGQITSVISASCINVVAVHDILMQHFRQ
ncbi:site-specific DNA-methyltransferase [Methylobacterium radiotolerans]|nr:site-specific DNA-methyltransferase [Methylobacterium radiotolerans]